MASLLTDFCNFLVFMALLSSLQLLSVSSLEFDVGGTNGWVVPNANNSQFYNMWASKNRFLVGDVVVFQYKKDSVMVVNEDDYKKCNSTHPISFSNTGKSTVELDRPGFYYFISGASGHCEKGQKMVIKVLGHAPEAAPSNSSDSSTGAVMSAATVSSLLLLQLVLAVTS